MALPLGAHVHWSSHWRGPVRGQWAVGTDLNERQQPCPRRCRSTQGLWGPFPCWDHMQCAWFGSHCKKPLILRDGATPGGAVRVAHTLFGGRGGDHDLRWERGVALDSPLHFGPRGRPCPSRLLFRPRRGPPVPGRWSAPPTISQDRQGHVDQPQTRRQPRREPFWPLLARRSLAVAALHSTAVQGPTPPCHLPTHWLRMAGTSSRCN